MTHQDTGKTMTTSQEQSEKRSLIIPFVLSVLIAVIVIQGWYLLDMKRQVDDIRANSEALSADTPARSVDTEIPAGSTPDTSDEIIVTHDDKAQETGSQDQPVLQATAEPGSTLTVQQQKDPADHTAAGQANTSPGGAGAVPAPQVAPRSPFDDPFFRRSFRHGFDDDPYVRDPYREIEHMRQEMDAIMRDAFNRHGIRDPLKDHPLFHPPARDERYKRQERRPDRSFELQSTGNFQVRDRGDRYLVILAIPGAEKNHIKVDIDERKLTVSGEQRQTHDRTDQFGDTTFRQQMSSRFKHRVSLPGPVIPESMRTRFNGDVLEIMVAKAR